MKSPIEEFPRSPGKKDESMRAKAKKERDLISPPCSGGHAFAYAGKPMPSLRCLCRAITYGERHLTHPPGFR